MTTSQNPKVRNKLLAFEYAVLSMVEWNTSQHFNAFLPQFMEKSNFTAVKVLLFPFYISTVKESRQVLFSLFDRFYPTKTGHMEWDVQQHLPELRHLNVQPERLGFKDPHFSMQQLRKAKEELKNDLGDEEIISAIDIAVEILRYKSKDFVNYDSEALTYFSQRHISWRLYWDYFHKTKHLPIINKDILMTESSELYLPSRKTVQKMKETEALVGLS